MLAGAERTAIDWPALIARLDDDSALELARRLPVPTRAAECARLQSELGRSAIHDELVVERVAATPGDDALERLRLIGASARRGELLPSVAAAAAMQRGAFDRSLQALDLFDDSLRREPDWTAYSRHAFDQVVGRDLSNDRAGEVAAVEFSLFERHPELLQLRIDSAAAEFAAGRLDRADELFAAGAVAEESSRATASLERRALAHLGRAWVAVARGDWDAARTEVAAARRWPRAPFKQEDALHVLTLRAAFVDGVITAFAGGSPRKLLADALATTPVDVERCFVDEAWFGPLGIPFGAELLRRRGRADSLADFARTACDAIEATSTVHRHGLLGPPDESAGDDEPLASWTFLKAAEALLADGGDPDAALAFVESRLARLERSQRATNRELLFETRLFQSRCHLHRGDAEASSKAIDAAAKVASGLVEGASREWLARLARRESPLPPVGRVVLRSDAPFSQLTTRVLVARANLEATLRGDAARAAADLFDAGAAWPWDGDRWMRCALDFARRGRRDDARACLAFVDDSPDHAYDLACVRAQFGEAKAAIELLRRHLAARTFTPAGRALEIGFMRRDHDLAPVRDDPEFPRE